MSVATPTVLARNQIFPSLLPRPPQPHPLPLPKPGRHPVRLGGRRDLVREMDDLSDEENELEDITQDIKNRGYNFLIPLGRLLTQQEEKNDADEDTDQGDGDDGSESQHSGGPHSVMDEENDSGQDLDADMDDLDDQFGDTTAETEDADETGEGDTEDLDEEPSEG